MKKQELEQRTKYVLSKAPHLTKNNVENWLQELEINARQEAEFFHIRKGTDIQEHMEKEINWHIRRLFSFGGSDMSTLLYQYQNKMTPFGKTAHDIISEKLCMTINQDFNNEEKFRILLRGKENEKMIEEDFLYQMRNIGLKPHPIAYDYINDWREKGGDKDHPWLEGSPDFVGIDNTNKVWIVDFKYPGEPASAKEMAEKGSQGYYEAQLHQYKLILEKAGMKVDKLALAPFDSAQYKTLLHMVDIDKQLEKDILEAGDYYYNDFYLKSMLPPPVQTRDFTSVQEIPLELQKHMAIMAYHNKAKNRHTKLEDEQKEMIKSLTSLQSPIGDLEEDSNAKTTRLGYIDIKTNRKKTLVSGELTKLALENGIDPADEEYNPDSKASLLINAIKEKTGLSDEEINQIIYSDKVSVSATLSRKKNIEHIVAVEEQLPEIIKDGVDDILESFESRMLFQEVEAKEEKEQEESMSLDL